MGDQVERDMELLEGKLLHEQVDVLVNLKPVQIIRITLATKNSLSESEGLKSPHLKPHE